MKNKLIFLSILFVFFTNLEKTFSDELKFEAIEIQIKDDGNILHAKDGVNITSDNGVEIIADSFEYNKKKQILFIEGEVEIINNELVFDYKLRNGVCKNKSATFLMQKMEVI